MLLLDLVKQDIDTGPTCSAGPAAAMDVRVNILGGEKTREKKKKKKNGEGMARGHQWVTNVARGHQIGHQIW